MEKKIDMEKATDQQKIIYELSEEIIKAQRPIRVLDSLKWTPEIKKDFFDHSFEKLPPVDAEYYREKNPLTFDPEKKQEEFHNIERNVRRQLGQFSGVGKIMTRMCREYIKLVELLIKRGTHEFTEISQELYGSSADVFYAGAPTLNDLASSMTEILATIGDKVKTQDDEKKYTSEEAVEILNERLKKYFDDPEDKVRVKLSDGILADSSAGAEYIKIRKDARFSDREIRALEVHEGWVHLGTTLNGLEQPYCTFLSKGPPSSTQTQEGLATVMEIFNFTSYPGRVIRLTDRITAINMAENGADFIEVFQFFLNRGHDEEQSYANSVRVFRGSLPNAGPFTKDLTYTRGFVFTYNYIKLAIKEGLIQQLPLLFLGKVTLEDIHILNDLIQEGVAVYPKHVPPQFRDLAALSAWMSYTIFLNKLNLTKVEADYKQILLD